MAKKIPSPTFHSGKPATSETPAQIVSTIRGDVGLIRADDAQEAPATTAKTWRELAEMPAPEGPPIDIQKRLAADLATNDFDGDGKAGGSLQQIVWDCAETAWGACHAWAMVKGVRNPSWANLLPNQKLTYAQAAKFCMDNPTAESTLVFEPVDDWESHVRTKIFASVVRAIAL